MTIIEETKKKMRDSIEHFKKELANLRTGRANAGILDPIAVEVYGSQMKIKELANVTTPESRQILITPFDPQTAGPIAKAIEKANIGMQSMLEGNVVRINVPPLDEGMRKDIVKQAKERSEKAKVFIRQIRRDSNDALRSDSSLTEDEKKRDEKKVQEFTDDHCKQVDEIFSRKEKEILTV